MKWQGVNIEEKLNKNKVVFPKELLLKQLDDIWEKEHQREVTLLKRLKQKPSNNYPNNHFKSELINANAIYHINDIKKICIDYRLRFLSTHYFKGDIPWEAISKIKDLEKKHESAFYNFKIIAPSKLFRLKNFDDPLLFIPIGNGYYHFVHKWGKDLHPLRKTWAWFFKSLENLVILCLLVSMLFTAIIPQGLFTNKPLTITIYFFEYLFMFKSVIAVVLFYGFSKGKNFNTEIWNSEYLN